MTSWNWRSSYAKKWYIARQNEFFRRIKQRICSFSTIRLKKSSLTNSMRSESKSIIRTRSTKSCIVIWRTFMQMMLLICMRRSMKSNSCLRKKREWKLSEFWQFRITKNLKLDLIKLDLSTFHTHKLCTIDFLFSFFLKSIFSIININ